MFCVIFSSFFKAQILCLRVANIYVVRNWFQDFHNRKKIPNFKEK